MVRPGKLVLIVDRDLDFVEDVRMLLRDHRVLSARSMGEAVEIAIGGRVDVVVLGPSFGSEAGVRSAADLFVADHDLSVVLVANIVTNRVLRAALQVGLVDVVDTPVTLRKLRDALERADDRPEPVVAAVDSPLPERYEASPVEPVAAAPAAVEGVELVFGGAAIEGRILEFGEVRAPDPQPAPVAETAPLPSPVVMPELVQAVPEPVIESAVEPAVSPAPAVDPTPVPEIQPVAEVEPVPEVELRIDEAPAVVDPGTPAAPAGVPPLSAVPPSSPPPSGPPPGAPPLPAGAPPMPMAAPPVAMVPETIAPAQIPTREPVAVERPAPRPLAGSGTVIAVTAGKAGSGKTVTATNLAAALTDRLGPDRVVVVDADLQFGDVALLLQLDPSRTVVEAAEGIDTLTDARLDSMLLRHESGLRVLPAPLLPLPPESVPIAGLIGVIERLKRMYEIVVVDTPPIFGPTLLSILDHSNTVLMVVDMDLPSVKNAKIAVDTLRGDGYPADRLHLVVNRVNSKARLDLVELERSLGLRVSGSIPSDRIVPQSVNEGIPAVLLSPRSRVAKSFHALAERFSPERARRAS